MVTNILKPNKSNKMGTLAGVKKVGVVNGNLLF